MADKIQRTEAGRPQQGCGFVHPATPPELLIALMPRGEAVYRGTWAQLGAEGLLEGRTPPGSDVQWKEGGLDYWLYRVRLPGLKAKDCNGLVDYWCVRVRRTSSRGTNFAEARIYAAEQHLAGVRFDISRDGRRQLERAIDARTDSSFQAFLRTVGIPPKMLR